MSSRIHCSQTLVNFAQELFGAHLGLVFQSGEEIQIACHNAFLNGLDGGLFQIVGIPAKIGNAVQLTALSERSAPRKERRNRVGRCLYALEMLLIMAVHSAVRSFRLRHTVG